MFVVVSVEVELKKFIVTIETYKEYFFVDESSPVVDTLEFESSLDGSQIHELLLFLEVTAIVRQSFEKVIAGVEAQHTVFGITFFHFFAIPSAVTVSKLFGGRK